MTTGGNNSCATFQSALLTEGVGKQQRMPLTPLLTIGGSRTGGFEDYKYLFYKLALLYARLPFKRREQLLI